MPVRDLLMRTHAPLIPADIAALKQLGLHVEMALANNTYRVRGESDKSLAELHALPFVAEVTDYDPLQKLDEGLQAMAFVASRAGDAAATLPVNVLVSLDPQTDLGVTVTALEQIGQVVESSPRRALVLTAPTTVLDIAALPGVLAVEVEPDNRTSNNVARGLARIEPVVTSLGLDGSGEIVGVADSGLDNGLNNGTMLADFAGRIVNIRDTVNKAAFGVADGADLNNHGTHVCGSILGSGANSNGRITGMAPAAQLTMLAMGPNNGTGLSVPIDLVTGVFQDAYTDGARIHSNSWGNSAAAALGKYSAQSQDVDEFVRDHPDMLIVFAAGNNGPGASTVTPPGTAKNCLTVGASESVRPLPGLVTRDPNVQDADFNPATPPVNVPLSINTIDEQADNADHIAVFSSRGPLNDTGDTRIKPDLVAPGTWILSCRSSVSTADVGPDGLPHVGAVAGFYANDADGVATHAEAVGLGLPGGPIFGSFNQNTPAAPAGAGVLAQQNYFYNSGTSMATPIVAGAATLLRQYLRERRGLANPSAALLKALLINGATVPAGESNAPNSTRGFGWLNLEHTIAPAPTRQQSYSDDIDLAVATGDVRQFSVQVADPAQPLRVTLAWTDQPGKGVQNQLYLRVIPPVGAPIDGDVAAFPTVRNNVQRVHIPTPMAGTYTIEVHGVQVLFGIPAHLPALRQDFALAVINGIGFSPNPVDICQVLDKSGSMGFYGFMEPAKERAKQLVDMLRINDRAGVVAFDGAATLVNPVVPIAGLATQQAIKTAVDLVTPGGVTSIGGGLQLGQAQLAAGGVAGHPQALVLISDGHENTPPWVGGGLPDSPPAWYGGPNFSEVLPTIPASTQVYTVSLGVQSDEVLLQAIAAARGGVFYGIHSPADIGKLHEIYVHLQALTGGEEVIATGNSVVDGVNVAVRANGHSSNGAPVDGVLHTMLDELLDPDVLAVNPMLGQVTPKNLHRIPVDESVRSLVLMVSWHNPQLPVGLTLISPSQQVIEPGNVRHLNRTGSSYQFFRIEAPEPGVWQMQVRSARQAVLGLRTRHAYTWGAYGTTPLGIRCELPEKRLGQPQLRIVAQLRDPAKAARTLRFGAGFTVPTMTTGDLIRRLGNQLATIRLPFEPDTPRIDPQLARLVLLDNQQRAAGKPSIFPTRRRRITLTRLNQYAGTAKTPIAGLYDIRLEATGLSQKGLLYLRQSLCSVRV